MSQPYTAVTTDLRPCAQYYSITENGPVINLYARDTTSVKIHILKSLDILSYNDMEWPPDILSADTVWPPTPLVVYNQENGRSSVLTSTNQLNAIDTNLLTTEEALALASANKYAASDSFGLVLLPGQFTNVRYFAGGDGHNHYIYLAAAYDSYWPGGIYSSILPMFERHHTHSLLHKNPETTRPYQSYLMHTVAGSTIHPRQAGLNHTAQAVVALVTVTGNTSGAELYVADYASGNIVLDLTAHIQTSSVLILDPSVDWSSLRWILHTGIPSSCFTSLYSVAPQSVLGDITQLYPKPSVNVTMTVEIASTDSACVPASYGQFTDVLEYASAGDPDPCAASNYELYCADLR
jgi:hypothetical protein